MVHCDPHVEGVPYAFAPRVLLRRQIAAAADLGLSLSVGAEVEYFLVKRGPDGRLVTADASDDADQPCYDTRGVTRMYDHLAAVSDAMEFLGWGPYASDHEDGNGQFEQNFHYADALTTADRVTTLRYVIQMLAEQRGMIATYMPKPFTDRTGSGMHLHLSLWGEDGPRFPADEDPRGLGLSRTGYGFTAGLLAHAPAMQAVIAPTVNSYKRTGATSTASGATWAPRAATYGGNDRTHLVRIPDPHRVELRAGDGAASSHLAAAVALGAGLDGVRGTWTRVRRGSAPRTRRCCRARCSTRCTRSRATTSSPASWTRSTRARGCRGTTPSSSARSSTPGTPGSPTGRSTATSLRSDWTLAGNPDYCDETR